MSVKRKSTIVTKFSVKRLSKQIILLEFITREEMIKHLIRFQEAYENPKFKGKPFTMGQLREYDIQKNGTFDYMDSVHGMNFPSSIVDYFHKGLFDPLSKEENIIMNSVLKRGDSYYIIGAYDGCENDIIEHEICHGLYGTNDSYKEEINIVLGMFDLSGVFKFLKNGGYADDVLLDEAHAYLTIDSKYLKENKVKFDDEIVQMLLDIRRKYNPKTIY